MILRSGNPNIQAYSFLNNQQKYKIKIGGKEKILNVLSLFSGIGAFEKALKNQNINYNLIGFSEIDRHAIKSYCIIHNELEEKNLGDIKKINEKQLKNFDLMTYGFPCQDISIAGKQKGISKETRSGLFYEALRIAKYKKPKYLIAENVEALTTKKFEKEFKEILNCLNEAGYNNYWQVIDAIKYIPQSRKRVYIISIRKDIDTYLFNFNFTPQTKYKSFYDLIDSSVSEKYSRINYFKSKNKYKNLIYNKNSIIKLIDNKERIAHRNDGNIYTLTASGRNCGSNQYICELGRILTPIESFKFMGFEETDCIKCIDKGVSETQLYKQAGNSIVVNVLEEILNKLLK